MTTKTAATIIATLVHEKTPKPDVEILRPAVVQFGDANAFEVEMPTGEQFIVTVAHK